MLSDKDSTMVRSAIRVHFYAPGAWMPWWLRAGWRPTFSHVAIEPVPGAIHDLPKDGTAAWWETEPHQRERPPTVTLDIPGLVSMGGLAPIIAWTDNLYTGRRVEKIRCALWYLRLWRRRRPRSCATLAALWLKLASGIQSTAVTPDELYEDLDDIMECRRILQRREHDRK